MNKIIYFVLGAAVGSVVTWSCTKNYFARLADEEIESVKETFSRRDPEKKKDPVVVEYEQKLEELGYTKKSEETRSKDNDIYVISPHDFGEFDNYDQITLTYYADGVLTDENNGKIDDPTICIGDGLNHFGEYDSVCVRNDRLSCDYEILLDLRKYSDVVKTLPRSAEVDNG